MTTPQPVVVLHPWDLARRMLRHGAALLPLALLSPVSYTHLTLPTTERV